MKKPSNLLVLETLEKAARASGRVLMQTFQTRLTISMKADHGLVTNADLESEKACLRVLKKNFPQFGILSEETPADARALLARSPGLFIVDPLDGTSNYAHGLTIFCVTLAFQWEGQTEVGVTYHPPTRSLYSAIRGGGARFNRKKIRVSETRDLKSAFFSTGFCSRKEVWLKTELAAFERASRLAGAVRRPGSAALDLAHISRGVFDGFWERELGPWDLAAGALLIEEAGGKITDFDGKILDIYSGRVAASNGFLHDALLTKIIAS